jgi:hypothetical protein
VFGRSTRMYTDLSKGRDYHMREIHRLDCSEYPDDLLAFPAETGDRPDSAPVLLLGTEYLKIKGSHMTRSVWRQKYSVHRMVDTGCHHFTRTVAAQSIHDSENFLQQSNHSRCLRISVNNTSRPRVELFSVMKPFA